MVAERNVFYDEDVRAFNKSQTEKIVEIKKNRLAVENSKRIARERFRATMTTVLLLAVFSLMLGVVIYKNSQVNEKKYEIFALKSEIKSLNTQIEELQTAVEHTSDIKTVEKMAIETLNMQYPTNDQYVYITGNENYAVSEATLSALSENDTSNEVAQVNQESSLGDTITALLKTN